MAWRRPSRHRTTHQASSSGLHETREENSSFKNPHHLSTWNRNAGTNDTSHGMEHELHLDRSRRLPASLKKAMAGDAASFVLSRFPHPDTAAADGAAFVDAATGGSLSFVALRRAALSLASGLRFGLGLRRGHAVLILSPNSLLLPQIVLGVLAAGGVVVAADPDATSPAQISAAARDSGAVIIVAAPEVSANAAGAGVPLLLTTTRSLVGTLSAEELIHGGDPTALAAPEDEEAAERPRPSDVAFMAYSSSASKKLVMTHADLIAAAIDVGELGARVCLASIPMCRVVHGLPLLALGLPAAGATTVLVPPLSDDPRAAREAVAVHCATDVVVATPEAAAVLAAPMPQDGRLSSLRRVMIVASVPLAAEARLQFRRNLPWVELTELFGRNNKRQTTTVLGLGDVFSRLNTLDKNLTRKEPDHTCISKL